MSKTNNIKSSFLLGRGLQHQKAAAENNNNRRHMLRTCVINRGNVSAVRSKIHNRWQGRLYNNALHYPYTDIRNIFKEKMSVYGMDRRGCSSCRNVYALHNRSLHNLTRRFARLYLRRLLFGSYINYRLFLSKNRRSSFGVHTISRRGCDLRNNRHNY